MPIWPIMRKTSLKRNHRLGATLKLSGFLYAFFGIVGLVTCPGLKGLAQRRYKFSLAIDFALSFCHQAFPAFGGILIADISAPHPTKSHGLPFRETPRTYD